MEKQKEELFNVNLTSQWSVGIMTVVKTSYTQSVSFKLVLNKWETEETTKPKLLFELKIVLGKKVHVFANRKNTFYRI